MDLALLIARPFRARQERPNHRFGHLCAIVAITLCCFVGDAAAVRIKDLASVKGVRANQLLGYGLVVGLNGTGDKSRTEFTTQSLKSMLSNMGSGVDPTEIKVKNVAAVMVTADLPAFSRTGSSIDVDVSSLGDAKSLAGGTLLMTPLFGNDGEVYAIAQGPISVGGFAAHGAGTSVQKNHPTGGHLVNGAIVERELDYSLAGKQDFVIALHAPDFTTALRAARSINAHFGTAVATPEDAGTLDLAIPGEYEHRQVEFMAEVEGLDVTPDRVAKVILNERTGTIVMGSNVRISEVAVSHGSLTVVVNTTNQVSQPAPLSNGRTTAVRNADVSAEEEGGKLHVIPAPVTIGDLVRGLNAMGVTPRDLIAILQAIKAAGAMSAEVELM